MHFLRKLYYYLENVFISKKNRRSFFEKPSYDPTFNIGYAFLLRRFSLTIFFFSSFRYFVQFCISVFLTAFSANFLFIIRI